MKVYEAYEAAIRAGMGKDPRPEDEVRRVLDAAASEYERSEGWRRECFDTERLWNPYSDCRFSALEELACETEASRMMWGIDIGPAEVLLADRLRSKGERIDAVVAHHPTGKSRNLYPNVIPIQADMYHAEGVPINVAEGIIGPRTSEVLRGVMGSNYDQAADAARMLGIPMFNVHSAADNMVQDYLTRLMDERAPRTLGDIVDVLMGEPEYVAAAKRNCIPTVMVGSKDSRCGRIMCKMTGGTSGPKEMYEALARAGVGTVIAMHFPESHYDAAREAHVNLVVSGHMPSDSLGVNLICDIWEREGIEVVPCSGFIRCSRNRHVRAEIHDHTRRVGPRLRVHPQEPGQQGRAALPPGDALPPARPRRPPVHRVPHRRGGYREDGHRPQVLPGHGRLHGIRGEGPRCDLRELPEHLGDRRSPAAHQALRPGVPGQGLLAGRHGEDTLAASRIEPQGDGGDPRRGGRPPEEGLHRSGLSADAHEGGLRPGVGHHDLPGAPGHGARRGVALHVQEDQRCQVRPLQQGRAQGDRRVPRRGGAVPRQVLGRCSGCYRRGGRRVRRRQDGDRAPGQGGEHRRGGRFRRDRRRPCACGQGHDIQRGVRLKAPLPRHQQEAGASRRGPRHEEEPLDPGGRRREDLCGGVRGVRDPRQEAHAVLEVPPGPGQDRGDKAHRGGQRDRQDRPCGSSGHTVQGTRREDGGDPGGGR